MEVRGSVIAVNLLGQAVPLFAYPNGKPGEDYDERSVALAREAGFEAAFNTVRGAATAGSDLFELPRFTPWDRSRFRFGARMFSTLCRPGRAAVGTAALGLR